jgi:hypothetical protein
MEVEPPSGSSASVSQPGLHELPVAVYSPSVYHETCDVRKLHWIVEHAHELDLGRSYVRGKFVEGAAQISLVKKYYKRMLEGRGTIAQTYIQHNGRGRRFVEQTGLQCLSRKIRHTIAGDLRDLDVSNAQPTMLQWYCERQNIPCPCLRDYNLNRNDRLHDLMHAFSISKDQAKKLLLKAMNKYQNQYQQTEDDPEWLYAFHLEMRQISLAVMIANPAIELEARTRKDHNIAGSTLNRVLCEIENRVLGILERVLHAGGAEIRALCFDGLMVSSVTEVDPLILACERAVLEEMELALRICEKPMNEGYVVPPEQLVTYDPWLSAAERKRIDKRIIAGQNECEFLDLVAQFERTHAKILKTSNFIHIDTDGTISFMTRAQMFDTYEHMRYGDEQCFITDWFKYPNIRRYDRVEVVPGTAPDNVYNLWTPFTCAAPYEYESTPSVLADRDFLLSHIAVLCNHDEAVTTYVTHWVAQMLQYPEHKTRMLLFVSSQGAGKDSFLTWLSRMMGAVHVLETTTPEREVWGDFNQALSGDTYLIALNELSRRSLTDAEDKIKGLITDPWLYINPKGKASYKIRSFHRFIGFTNTLETVRTTKDDRRTVIIQSSDEKVGDTEYFTRYYELLENRAVIQACYDYLMSINVKEFHKLMNKDVPLTEFQKDLQTLAVSPIESFVAYLVSEDERYQYSDEIVLSSVEMLAHFNQYLESHRIKYEVNSRSFGMRLKNLKIDGVQTGFHTMHGNKIKVDRKAARRYLQIDLVPLSNRNIEHEDMNT